MPLSAIPLLDGTERWTGMLGLLYKDKMDMAVGSIFYLQSKVGVSEIHVPIVNVHSMYVVPRLVLPLRVCLPRDCATHVQGVFCNAGV